MYSPDDTIVALATPPGRGGLGVVRISGPRAQTIAQSLIPGGRELQPRLRDARTRDGRRSQPIRPVEDRRGGRDVLPRGRVLHRRGCRGVQPAWQPRGAGRSDCGGRCARRAAGAGRRIHAARIPERPAGPDSCRGRARPGGGDDARASADGVRSTPGHARRANRRDRAGALRPHRAPRSLGRLPRRRLSLHHAGRDRTAVDAVGARDRSPAGRRRRAAG